ncbi:hypothetical protein ACFQ4O_08665 [Methylopila musalis]|uniref:Uncharacterized protein n=1 Tax=Methylopila musalis TaxID=1134781 RepID=A0ABW3Z714_9HYPH
MPDTQTRALPTRLAVQTRRVWPFRAAAAKPVASASARPKPAERDLVVWIARARRELSS